jgi:uncharacterized membrane protein (UPF0182 family)
MAVGKWLTVLRFVHQRPFGATDPLIGQHVAVYVLTLPCLRFLEGWLTAALLLEMMGTLRTYGLDQVQEELFPAEKAVTLADVARVEACRLRLQMTM